MIFVLPIDIINMVYILRKFEYIFMKREIKVFFTSRYPWSLSQANFILYVLFSAKCHEKWIICIFACCLYVETPLTLKRQLIEHGENSEDGRW